MVLGEVLEGDLNVECFVETMLGLGCDVERISNLDAQRNLENNVLVLFCVRRSSLAIRESLRKIRDRGAHVIVYAEADRASGDFAVECCHDGLANDFFVGDSRDSRDHLHRHTINIYRNDPLYPRFELNITRSSAARLQAFIATPYLTAYSKDIFASVGPALKRLQFDACWSDMVLRRSSITSKIGDQIQNSQLLIANIIENDPDLSRHNANVYFEAGQAAALNIPLILVRPKTEHKLELPADIQSLERVEYENSTDLALRLYFGLRDRIR